MIQATAVVVGAEGINEVMPGMQVDAMAVVVQVSVTEAAKPAIGDTVALVVVL